MGQIAIKNNAKIGMPMIVQTVIPMMYIAMMNGSRVYRIIFRGKLMLGLKESFILLLYPEFGGCRLGILDAGLTLMVSKQASTDNQNESKEADKKNRGFCGLISEFAWVCVLCRVDYVGHDSLF